MNHDLIKEQVDTTVQALGRPAIDSPLQSNTIFVKDTERVVIDTSLAFFNQCTAGKSAPLSFELAGPRKKIYFDPSKTKCGIVTCGADSSARSLPFQLKKIPINFKYLDPSYIIRSVTANASDSIFCGFLAQMAVHAGLSGKTDMLIGLWNNVYVNIPNEVCLQGRKKIDTNGPLWMSVRESTGQPSMSHKEGVKV